MEVLWWESHALALQPCQYAFCSTFVSLGLLLPCGVGTGGELFIGIHPDNGAPAPQGFAVPLVP